jgi:hypothetical protein
MSRHQSRCGTVDVGDGRGEMTVGSCLTPAMFLGQSEASNVIDASIHLWWGAALNVGATAATT